MSGCQLSARGRTLRSPPPSSPPLHARFCRCRGARRGAASVLVLQSAHWGAAMGAWDARRGCHSAWKLARAPRSERGRAQAAGCPGGGGARHCRPWHACTQLGGPWHWCTTLWQGLEPDSAFGHSHCRRVHRGRRGRRLALFRRVLGPWRAVVNVQLRFGVGLERRVLCPPGTRAALHRSLPAAPQAAQPSDLEAEQLQRGSEVTMNAALALQCSARPFVASRPAARSRLVVSAVAKPQAVPK